MRKAARSTVGQNVIVNSLAKSAFLALKKKIYEFTKMQKNKYEKRLKRRGKNKNRDTGLNKLRAKEQEKKSKK